MTCFWEVDTYQVETTSGLRLETISMILIQPFTALCVENSFLPPLASILQIMMGQRYEVKVSRDGRNKIARPQSVQSNRKSRLRVREWQHQNQNHEVIATDKKTGIKLREKLQHLIKSISPPPFLYSFHGEEILNSYQNYTLWNFFICLRFHIHSHMI